MKGEASGFGGVGTRASDGAASPPVPGTARGPRSALVDYASRLPSLPAVALEVVRLSKQEWVALDDLAQVISRDPALALKLLKLANSPLYLRRRPATTSH